MLMDEAEHYRGGEKRSDCDDGDQGDDDDGTRTKECKSEQASPASDSFNAASPSASSCPTPINGDIGLLVPKCEPEEIVCAVDCADGLCPTHIDPYESNVDPHFPKCEMEELGIAVEGSCGPSLAGPPCNATTTAPNSSGFVNCWSDPSSTNSNMPITGPRPCNTAGTNSGSICCWWDPSIVNKSKNKNNMSTSKPVAVFCCETCGDCFASVKYLNRHRYMTHREKPEGKFQCALCPYTSNRRYDVDAHERTHNGVKPFVCDVCHRGFVQRSQLHVHQKSHSGERPHECLECGKRFVLLSHLNYHRNNVHNKAEKPHVCPQCGRGFVRRAVLNRHMQSHETRKPYICSVCGWSFSRMDNAKTHFWRKHSELDGVIYTRPVTSVSSSVSEGACSYGTSNDGQEESSALYDRATPHILGVAGVLETADTSNLHALSRP